MMVRIDLHGVRHEEVRGHLVTEIEKYWGMPVDLEIITGHSPQMRKIVCEVLEEYNLDFDLGLHPSYIRVFSF